MNSMAYVSTFTRQNTTPVSAKLALLALVVTAHMAVFYVSVRPSDKNALVVNEMSVNWDSPAPTAATHLSQQRMAIPLHLPIADQITREQAAQVVEPAHATAETVAEASEPDYKATYLNNTPPAYPMAARRMGLQGKVVLHVEVLAEGICGKINIQDSSGYAMLDNAALEAVKLWRFVPARQAGHSVDKWFIIPVQFSLKDNAA